VKHVPNLLTEIARMERARADQWRAKGKHRAKAAQADAIADECIEARRILERELVRDTPSIGASE
jgi:hypothetical protein